MTAKLSKADKIRKLLHLPNAVIAERTGYAEPYIRSVRQRTDADGNPIRANGDIAWYPRKLQNSRERYASDPEYRQRRKDISSQCYWRKRRAEARAS